MIKLPARNSDLKRYVRKKDVRRVILYLIWMALWYSGAVFYNYNHQTYPPERQMVGWKLLLWMLGSALLGFFVFRIYLFFTDRTYRGVIAYSGLSQTYEASRDPGIDNAVDWDFRLNTALQVAIKGRKKNKRVHFEQKIGFYFYYYEGTEIVKLHGLPYPLAVNRFHPDARARVCLACGQVASEECTRCESCYHTLVDPATLLIKEPKTK